MAQATGALLLVLVSEDGERRLEVRARPDDALIDCRYVERTGRPGTREVRDVSGALRLLSALRRSGWRLAGRRRAA